MQHPGEQAIDGRPSATQASRATPKTKQQKGWRRPPSAIAPTPWRQNRSQPLFQPQCSKPKTPSPRTSERASGQGCGDDVGLTRATRASARARVASRLCGGNPCGCTRVARTATPTMAASATLAKLLLPCGYFFDSIEVGLITQPGGLGHPDSSVRADGYFRGDNVLRPVPPAG